MKQFRQGDLLIQEIESLPKNIKKHNLILLRGESTGHAHRMESGEVFSDKLGNLYISLAKTANVVHKEHSPIELPKGLYAVKRQREYAGKDMIKIVVD